eukprot:CAMPEP_0119045832 /NCGR_PEP_ID=MMETSP1177-20130426/42804_1 /TAXON_ID=2985 /ORGANISM="Ochromonas sp, Strain CCMP1899" /LENGTH=154 /DNA_ID=CAMNT_0007018215 /DNA_START=361 /DNA_END=822 /DNA_ORIENTATION=-
MILDEKEMDRQLEQNDEDDGDEDEELSENEKIEIENEKKIYQNENEDDNMDINLVSDTAIDRSIQMAVQKMVDSGPKAPELSRTETFDIMYKALKSQKDKNNSTMDPTEMLAALFSDSQRKDPFDERKVMMKFRTMLKNEDFESLFRDPLIGDF